MEEKLERIVTFRPAFDRRDPDPKKNYGIHGVELRMVVRGSKGATQFLLYTNWHLPHVQRELDMLRSGVDNHISCHPLPADLGYRALAPQYEGQTEMECDLLPGGKCYYDGSGMNAERIYKTLLEKGDEGVWKELEDYYHELFDGEEAPEEEIDYEEPKKNIIEKMGG